MRGHVGKHLDKESSLSLHVSCIQEKVDVRKHVLYKTSSLASSPGTISFQSNNAPYTRECFDGNCMGRKFALFNVREILVGTR